MMDQEASGMLSTESVANKVWTGNAPIEMAARTPVLRPCFPSRAGADVVDGFAVVAVVVVVVVG